MKSKKIICLLLTMVLFFISVGPTMANNNITVKIDGQQIAFDVPPLLINNRTMVPLRAIFEALGATVAWNNDTQTVTSIKDNTTITLTINYPTMYVNGVGVTLDTPACLVGGRTLVPVRAISEAFGTTVDWIDNENTVVITTKDFNTSINNTDYINGAQKLVEYIAKSGIQKGIGYYIGKISSDAGETFTSEIRYIPDTGNLEFVQFSEYDEMSMNICLVFDPKTQTIVDNEIIGTFIDYKYFNMVLSKAFANAKTLSINTDYNFVKDPQAVNAPNNVYDTFNALAKLALVNWRTLIREAGIDVNSVGFPML